MVKKDLSGIWLLDITHTHTHTHTHTQRKMKDAQSNLNRREATNTFQYKYIQRNTGGILILKDYLLCCFSCV